MKHGLVLGYLEPIWRRNLQC